MTSPIPAKVNNCRPGEQMTRLKVKRGLACSQSENSRAWRSLRRPARLNVQQQACAPGKKHLSWRLLEKEAFAVGKPDLDRMTHGW